MLHIIRSKRLTVKESVSYNIYTLQDRYSTVSLCIVIMRDFLSWKEARMHYYYFKIKIKNLSRLKAVRLEFFFGTGQ